MMEWTGARFGPVPFYGAGSHGICHLACDWLEYQLQQLVCLGIDRCPKRTGSAGLVVSIRTWLGQSCAKTDRRSTCPRWSL